MEEQVANSKKDVTEEQSKQAAFLPKWMPLGVGVFFAVVTSFLIRTPSVKADEPSELVAIDEGVIDGGEIEELSPYKVDPIRGHEADTGRILVWGLLIILAIAMVLHYGSIAWLASQGITSGLDSLTQAFNTLITLIASLITGAVTYFFTRNKAK